MAISVPINVYLFTTTDPFKPKIFGQSLEPQTVFWLAISLQLLAAVSHHANFWVDRGGWGHLSSKQPTSSGWGGSGSETSGQAALRDINRALDKSSKEIRSLINRSNTAPQEINQKLREELRGFESQTGQYREMTNEITTAVANQKNYTIRFMYWLPMLSSGTALVHLILTAAFPETDVIPKQR